ncbi:MAG: prolyl oligopeptidase family serine peptidase [Deltaproteobacteria bacterium]|nr:prolyl oligopeptidase family serine peptidase [Deltaproteobacteria bacterium]
MRTIHQHVFFPSDNLQLEGNLMFPADRSSCPGVVICHPHPVYGGDMNNNVVMGIKAALEDAGFVILRFNFRGVNLSEGNFDGGKGEIKDVIAAVSFLKDQTMVDNNRLFLAGYSFGSWVGLKAVLKVGEFRAVAGVSPPFGIFNFDFLTDISAPILLMVGEQDDFCKMKEFESVFNKIQSSKKRVVLPGADHFCWEREGEVGEIVRSFFCC